MEHCSITCAADLYDSSQLQDTRPLANFHPHLWGDRFLNYAPPPQGIQIQREEELKELKERVRKKLLTSNDDDPKERFIYIDAIEQLGVAYHFEQELEAILQHFHHEYEKHDALYGNDLHFVSLRFRILRQHGLFVSCCVFEKFRNEDQQNFKESITKDVEGILNFYEASYLRVHGEKILDEAVQFTTTQLKSFVEELTESLATQVSRALKFPIHKCIQRLHSRYYIDTYESNPSHDKTLLRVAKIDFSLLQSMHLKELRDLSRWWKAEEFSTKLPFMRDRIVEEYLWALGTFPDPKYALGRAIFTKVARNITIMDDLYDAYGLFEELVPYTEAVHRWDKICMNKLPDYMKLTYEKLLDIFDGIEQDLAKEERSHLVYYVREQVKIMCQSYFQEAKWLQEKYVPTYDEYMKDAGFATSGYIMLSGVGFLGLGKIAMEEAFQWVSHNPKVVKAACLICRLMNDIVSHKKERKRNHVVSSVECFMAQYDVSEKKAEEEVYKKVEEAWKDLNEEMFSPIEIARPLLTLILNLSRVVEVFYSLGDDEFSDTSQNMRDNIHAIFINHVKV